MILYGKLPRNYMMCNRKNGIELMLCSQCVMSFTKILGSCLIPKNNLHTYCINVLYTYGACKLLAKFRCPAPGDYFLGIKLSCDSSIFASIYHDAETD